MGEKITYGLGQVGLCKKDGKLSSSHLGAPRTSTPTQLFLCFLFLELILHPTMELHSLLSR